MRPRLDAIIVALIFVTMTLFPFACANAEGANVHKTAQNYIIEFRRGVEFSANDRVGGIVMKERIAPGQLSLLTKELSNGTPKVRENIVNLLREIGLALDSPSPKKIQVIRDAAVIRALVVQGFAKDDEAARAAASVLIEHCLPADLATFNDVYTKSLEVGDGDYLYVAAKAKALQASQYVEKMARSPLWKEDEEPLKTVKIAQAALGNVSVEDEFIKDVLDAAEDPPPASKNRFFDVRDAKDGAEVASRMPYLGYVGTKKTLQAACRFLRSPLKTYVVNSRERSIRYDALDAILYNFPDERVLYNPRTWAEWAAAEQFCIEKLGATFDGPTPDLPQDVVYPRMR